MISGGGHCHYHQLFCAAGMDNSKWRYLYYCYK